MKTLVLLLLLVALIVTVCTANAAYGNEFAEEEVAVFDAGEEELSDVSIANGATLQATTGVNIRAGPCTNQRIVGSLSPGQRTTYTGRTQSGCGYTWYSIPSGWVASNFVKEVGGGGGGGGGSHTINAAGLNLIKSFEGFRSCKYRDPVGLWTIGYGHLIKPGESFNCISEAEATNLLRRDVGSAEACVNSRVKVPLNGNQFSALVSFTYNLGCGSLSSSTLLRLLNQGNYGSVCGQLKLWVNAGGRPLPGLVRRRNAEFKTREKSHHSHEVNHFVDTVNCPAHWIGTLQKNIPPQG